jgi:hypothetical protein
MALPLDRKIDYDERIMKNENRAFNAELILPDGRRSFVRRPFEALS